MPLSAGTHARPLRSPLKGTVTWPNSRQAGQVPAVSQKRGYGRWIALTQGA